VIPLKKQKTNIICSKEDWERIDAEEKIQKECKERKESFFIGNKPKPKKDRPKISTLTKRIYNWMVLQNE